MRQLKLRVNFSSLFFTWILVIATVVGFSEFTGAIEDRSNSETIPFKQPYRQPSGHFHLEQLRCPKDLIPLLAKFETSEYVGWTITDRPNLYFYNVGFKSGDKANLTISEFNYQELTRDEEQIYQASFNMPEPPIIVGISFPTDLRFQEGKAYAWDLEVFKTSGDSGVVSGLIERVPSSENLERKLNEAQTTIDRVRVLAEAGIWYDALETLARERQLADTPELQQQGSQLLRAGNLGDN
ncbi:MAG: DUF928 domain-containing protein, partial [Geitlerinemataceae cyanobacterium]